jgi:hypothetical protein
LDIVKDTVKELNELGLNGTLTNVVITKTQTLGAPWTLSYIRFDDGTIGCGVANNELKVPDDVSFIRSLLNSNAYDVIDELFSMESSVFINSVILSLVSALSYRLWEDQDLFGKNGYEIERLTVPRWPFSEFVRDNDVVALVGFATWDIPLLTRIAREVNVLELVDLKEFDVIDFGAGESKVKLFPAGKSEEVLSKADVVSITGETVVNDTIEEILRFSKNARTRIIYGPTSAFYPEVLFERGIDVSLPIVFPNTPEFQRQFVDSRGYWYQMMDVKRLLVKRRVS